MQLNSLPADLERFVEQEISAGKYQSAEELVGTALRLLQARDAESDHSRRCSNGHPEGTPRSADSVLRAISEALATGEHGLARRLAVDGAKQYPDHDELQRYGRILATPKLGKPVPSTSETRAGRTANRAWLEAHWRAYRGNWIALRAGRLLHASPLLDEVVAEVGEVRGTDVLLTRIA